MLRRLLLAGCAALGALQVASPASASERRFAFTYESAVAQAGDAELQPWTTFRAGREHYYSRVDGRVAFELGLSERLQTTLYWNYTAIAADIEEPLSGQVTREQSFELTTVDSEWQYELSDPIADSLGSALHVAAGLGPAQARASARLILDKQLGRWLLAANAVFEHEWEFPQPSAAVRTINLELPLGASYYLTPSLTLGLEVLPLAELYEGELESIAFYAGPALAAVHDAWWLSISILPQVFSPENPAGESLDLERGEHLKARLLLGFLTSRP